MLRNTQARVKLAELGSFTCPPNCQIVWAGPKFRLLTQKAAPSRKASGAACPPRGRIQQEDNPSQARPREVWSPGKFGDVWGQAIRQRGVSGKSERIGVYSGSCVDPGRAAGLR